MNTRSRLTLPALNPGAPQRPGHDIRLRMQIERTRLGGALIEQRLLTLELRQPPVNLSEQRFWSRQTLLRIIDLASAIFQSLRSVLQIYHPSARGF
ncbi:MAG TPA: hypothetical protein VJ755_11470 [Gemmatimonadales bacterium]|nr:hypothetical protein [Gemmatimonadales bacterium]